MLFARSIALGAMVVCGCVAPQSGNTTKRWCVPADSTQFEVVDDMEDGDLDACDGSGPWSILGAGTVTAPMGTLAHAADLNGADLTARRPSLRGLHLAGTPEAGGYLSFFLPLDWSDLTGFQEIQFWARSESGSLDVRVNVATAATTDAALGGECDADLGPCGDHFGDVALITEPWGDQGSPNSIALGAITQSGTGQVIADKDLAHTLGLEFRVSGVPAPAPVAFGFWLDDIQLKRPPGP